MPQKILIVEDEPTLRETLTYHLSQQGYEVKAAEDGLSTLETARRFTPDLLVLDLMLPKMDGIEVCRILRKEMTIPIIMLTARDSELDRVLGLEMGADDYISKPFSMRELQARIKALLRRVRYDREENARRREDPYKAFRFGNLKIDPKRREVFLDRNPIPIKPKEYELLLFLAQNQGKVIPRESILDQVWGWDFQGVSRTVDVHIRWLREKIETDPAKPTRIVTVRGAGYRFDG